MTMNMTPMTWSSFLTSWTSTPVADLLIIGATVVYVVAVLRARRSGETWPIARSVSWAVAMLVLVISINSGMATYAHNLFWMHMLVHLMLIMVVPTFLVWAHPFDALARGFGGRTAAAIDAVAGSRIVHNFLWPAIAIPLYAGTLVLTHLTGFQQAMGTHMWIHDAEMVLYLVAGYLLLLPLVGTDRIGNWMSPPLRLAVMALAMGVDTLVGITLMMTSTVLAPAYADSRMGWGPNPLTDQNAAGAIMWFGGDGLMMVLMVIVASQWIKGGNDAGLGSWLDGARRSTMFDDRATFGGVADDDGATIGSASIDDDQAALDAYNARLAAMNGRRPQR